MMTKQTKVIEICPTTTQNWIKNGAILLDVREKDEVAQLAFDVPGTLHIPLSEFERRYNEVPSHKAIVVVCRGGQRSLRAAGFLINQGYNAEKVVNMQHGMNRWAQKGFPTKGDITAISNNSGCCSTSGCC